MKYWCIKPVFMFILIFHTFASPPPPSRDDELVDYCATHKFNNKLANGLSFTKEVISTEYASIGHFKALHCCLRGYRSIEWYKDDRAYPWSGAISYFIIYPESANQTIYTQEVFGSDSGKYFCKARNDTNTVTAQISLDIVGEDSSGYTGKPLTTFIPISQTVSLGGTARLFCEAYLGKVDLPDARNSVTWSKADSNVTILSNGRVSQHRVSREDEYVVGSYLKIDATTLEDYGEYKCKISNGADEEIILSARIYLKEPKFMFTAENRSWKILLFVVVNCILVALLIISYIRYSLPLAVVWRNKFTHLEENDGKDFDALICYHEADKTLAFDTFLNKLEKVYCYKCTTLELSCANRNWNSEITPYAQTARRIIVIVSPQSLTNQWTDANVGLVLKQLNSIESQIIVITLNEVNNLKSFTKSNQIDTNCLNKIVLNKMTILCWKVTDDNKDSDNYRFWFSLRLVMPPVRLTFQKSAQSNKQSIAMIETNVTTKSVPEKTPSRESLEILV